MLPRIVILAGLALLAAQYAAASPRHTNNPAHRSIEQQQQRRAAEQEYRESSAPARQLITPSPNQVIGKVARVNHQQGFIVGWLHSRYLNLSGNIITRDERLRTTAVLAVGDARSNRAAGLRIVSGMPNVGDEIVAVSQLLEVSTPTPVANTFPVEPNQTGGNWQGEPPQATLPWPQQQRAQQPAAHRPPPARSQPQQPTQPTVQQPARGQEQPTLIPAHRLQNMRGEPKVETRITVTVE